MLVDQQATANCELQIWDFKDFWVNIFVDGITPSGIVYQKADEK